MNMDVLLNRLEGVRSTGQNRWYSRCPAHDDGSPSLSIRQADDRILINCHAGCGGLEVLEAVGLDWSALFPASDPTTHSTRKAPPLPYRDVLLALRDEAWVVLLCCDAAIRGDLNEHDAQRLALSVERLDRACQFIGRTV